MITPGSQATVAGADGGLALRDGSGRHPKIGIVYNGAKVNVLALDGNQAAVEIIPGSKFKMLSAERAPRGLVPLSYLSEVDS